MTTRLPDPRLLAAGALVVGLLAACGSTQGDRPDVDGPGPLTTRALAAATITHVRDATGVDATAAAPLAPRDGVPADAVGVEVAFPRPEGDSTHVRVVVGPRERAYTEVSCDGPRRSALAGCEERRVGGLETVLAWEAGYPEEDPGVIAAAARHDGWVVTARVTGPFVHQRLGGLRTLADAVVALVADPEVGPTTSEDLLRAGADIGDDVWLDWYGQGNGAPSPGGG